MEEYKLKIDQNIAQDVIKLALSRGGEYADLFFEYSISKDISYIDHKVDKIGGGLISGVGLRVIKDNKTIYLHSNDISNENLLSLAKKASDVVGSDINGSSVNLNEKKIENAHKYSILPSSVGLADKVEIMSEIDKISMGVSPKIVQVVVRYIEKEREILVASSDGVFARDKQVRVRLSNVSVASDGSQSQSAHRTTAALKGFEFINEADVKPMAVEASEGALTMLSASYIDSGKYPLVIENGFGGVIFHEACGHALEATSVADNASVFCGMKGKQIANEAITAYDDGTIENAWGSINIDDEGTKTQRTKLIENGILKNFMVDKLGSLKMNEPMTGSSRRETYEYIPTSRMRNTFIDAGADSWESLFNGIEFGVYAKTLGGGSVDPATTEFNFAVNEAYLIENGKITKPLRGATLIGTGKDILMDIESVSNNLKLVEGMCGSISGAIPTTVGQPTLKVKSITVGGR